ncbi:MAG: hypothetical protein ABSG96_15775 [Terracidiphilus sp.]
MTFAQRATWLIDWGRRVQFLYVCAAFVISGAAAKAVKALFETKIPSIWQTPLYLASFAVALFLSGWVLSLLKMRSSEQSAINNTSNALVAPAVTPGKFSLKEFFRLAYYSPLQAEAENNMRAEVTALEPIDREQTYLKIISIGLVAVIYDQIWWHIFRSQLLAMLELNRNGGLLPLDGMRTFYEKAEQEYPENYKDDTFERWLSYLQSNDLMLKHPSNMVEITVKGKDFLKYLLHCGREPHQRRL